MISFKKLRLHLIQHAIFIILLLWGADLVINYFYGFRYDGIDKSGQLTIGFALYLAAAYINPFCGPLMHIVKKPDSTLEGLTGLSKGHWEQASHLVTKYGSEAPAVLAVRESDDVLDEAEKASLRKTRIAVSFLIDVKKHIFHKHN